MLKSVQHFACIQPRGLSSCTVAIRASPNAKRSEVSSISDEEVTIRLGARAVDNKANLELCEYMSSLLGIKKRHVSVISGDKSRNKVLLIDGLDSEKTRDALVRASTDR